MAGIDKTYVTWEQYKQVKEFFTKEMKAKQKQDLGYYFGYADLCKKYFKDSELPIWNTGSLEDLWLAQNCKLSFIQERLHQQYPDNWIGWKEIDFSEKGFLISAKYKESYIAPYKELEEENMIETFDELLVYGTTFAHKFLYNVMAIIRKEWYHISLRDSYKFEVEFELFGLYIKAISTLDEVKYFIGDEEVYIGYFPKNDFYKDKFDKFFQQITIKHSYNKKDFLKYAPEQIVMSNENECFNVDMYKDFSKDNYKIYFSFLPDYIKVK